MKKALFFLLICFCFGLCFAQSFDEKERLLKGDLSLVESEVSDFALAKLENKELRLFRNMIFAKRGHSFDSKDLKEFFSQFEWYKPVRKVSDSEFDKDEKCLLERIKIFEARNEKAATVKFGNEIIGLWHASPVMPDTWVDRFLIYPENKMEFLVDYFVENPEVKEYLGRYQIRGNVLIFDAERLQKKDQLVSLKKPLVFKFPITNVFEEKFAGGALVRQTVQIGSLKYYLYYDDPSIIGAKARQY